MTDGRTFVNSIVFYRTSSPLILLPISEAEAIASAAHPGRARLFSLCKCATEIPATAKRSSYRRTDTAEHTEGRTIQHMDRRTDRRTHPLIVALLVSSSYSLLITAALVNAYTCDGTPNLYNAVSN